MPTQKNAFAIKQIEKFWKVLFREIPSKETVRIVAGFMKFGGGMIIAKVVSIAAQIVMGRSLGPIVYGQITIILLMASYFAMPMVNGWGLAFTKMAANGDQKATILQALKSLMVVVVPCSILTTIALVALQKPLAGWLNIDRSTMKLTIIMTLFYGWWILSKQIAQGLQSWSLYVRIENTWAFFALAGIVGCVLMSWVDLEIFCLIFFLAYFIAGIFTCRSIWRSFSIKINNLITWEILSHGLFLLMSGLVGMATFSIDRILINVTLGAADVGIYQAHFLATYGIISAFMTILLTYVFPVFCRDKNNNIKSFIQRLNKYQYPLTIMVSVFIGSVVLWLYSYTVSLLLFACLCVFAGVQFHVQLKTWYLSSKGTSATKFALKSQIVFLGVNVIALFVFLPKLGIDAGGVSLLLAACCSLVYLIIYEDKHSYERVV